MFNINNLSLRFSKCHKHSLEAEIFWKSQFLSHEESPCWFIYEASIGRMCMVEAEGWDDTDSGGCILTTCSLRYYGTSTFVQIYSYVHVCLTVHTTYMPWDHLPLWVHALTRYYRSYTFVQIYSYVHVCLIVHIDLTRYYRTSIFCTDKLFCTCLLDST